MFAGIGGFRTGLTNAGDFFMPVGWCEKDKHAQKAYRLLYGTEGEYLYHLRERDDGDGFASLESKVIVNHGGSVITNEPIALGEDGYIALSDENYPNFMGDTRTLAAFMGGDFPSQGLDLTM